MGEDPATFACSCEQVLLLSSTNCLLWVDYSLKERRRGGRKKVREKGESGGRLERRVGEREVKKVGNWLSNSLQVRLVFSYFL